MAKSDVLISPKFRGFLQKAFDKLKADQAACPDWHPGTDEKVLNLVHPSMFPLIYGQSRGFQKEVVGVEDAIYQWTGQGDILNCTLAEEPLLKSTEGEQIPEAFWSTRYQWLPANFEISGQGCVSITSYINNLHPVKYAPIYKMMEKLVEKALPLWDQCLYRVEDGTYIGAGRHTSRFAPPLNAE